jgi:hypothetical protein
MQPNEIYTKIIVPFIEGNDIISFKNSLAKFTKSKQVDAIHFFKIELSADEKKNIIGQFTTNVQTQTKYLQEYEQWLIKTNVSNELIHLLEFLAQNKSPRLRYLLKDIYRSKVKHNHKTTYLTLACLALLLFAANISFNPEWKKQLEDFQRLLSLALKTVFQTQNLAFLILMFQLIRYCTEIYYILTNNATTSKHKLDKLLRKSLTTLINIIAQILIIQSPNIMPKIANSLMVLSEFINILFSAWTLYQLKYTKKPSKDEHLTLEDNIHQLENHYYYLKKSAQFRLECASLVLSFTASVVSMLLSSHFVWLAPICLLIQFFISQIKNLYHSHLDDKYTELTQNDIKQIKKLKDGKEYSISFFSENSPNSICNLSPPDLSLSPDNIVTPV